MGLNVTVVSFTILSSFQFQYSTGWFLLAFTDILFSWIRLNHVNLCVYISTFILMFLMMKNRHTNISIRASGSGFAESWTARNCRWRFASMRRRMSCCRCRWWYRFYSSSRLGLPPPVKKWPIYRLISNPFWQLTGSTRRDQLRPSTPLPRTNGMCRGPSHPSWASQP